MNSNGNISERKKLFIICNDVVGKNMAGPAIRSWEMARALSRSHDVTLGIPNETSLCSDAFKLVSYKTDDKSILENAAEAADILLVQGNILQDFPFLKTASKPIVIDLYDPYILESIEHHYQKPERERSAYLLLDFMSHYEQLYHGDFFICASEKQKDFWLGLLMAAGRINPVTYDTDKSLQRLIDVVPFGIPPEPPRHTTPVLKGKYKSISKNDRVILWGGGIWDWFDPVTMIKAMSTICARRNDVKLFFMGVRHPNPDIPKMVMTQRVIDLSKTLGLFDTSVFFNDWVPYAERQNYLLEADVGVSLHMNYIESRFSFRTRLLDNIWTSLPVITTKGDTMAELVDKFELGITVDFQDAEQVADAVLTMIDNPDFLLRCRTNLRQMAENFTWEEVTRPLERFCQNPRKVADEKYRKELNVNTILDDKENHIGNLEKVRTILEGHIDNLKETLETQRQKIDKIKKSLPYRMYLKLTALMQFFGFKSDGK